MSSFAVDNKKIAKNTIVLYFRMAFTMLVSFFATRIALEVLGSEDYGLNNLVGGVVAMFSFINGSMGTAVQRFYSIAIGEGDVEKLKRIFGCGLFLHIIVAVLTLCVVEIFAVFFLHTLNIPFERMDAAQLVFQFAIISMCFGILSVPYAAMLRARENFSVIAIVDIITAILRLLILFFLIKFDYDKLILFASFNFFISLFNILFLVFSARKYEETHSFICIDKTLIKEMLSFVSLLLFTVLAQVLRDNGLTILVNIYFGLYLNAAFAIAIQVSHMVTTFVMNFKQAIVPQLMTAWGANKKYEVISLINIGTKVTFLLLIMLSFPIIFESEFILNIWLKEPPVHASQLVSLAVVSINISSFTYFLYQAVHATGKIKQQQIWMSMLYILNIFFIYISFRLGKNYYYAYYITILISLFQCVVNVYFANKYINLSLRDFCLNIVLRCCFVFIFLSFLYFLFVTYIDSNWMRFILGICINVLLCVVLGYFVLLDSVEKDKVKLFLLNKIKFLNL